MKHESVDVLFDRAAAQRPIQPAISRGAIQISYAALLERANTLANFLIASGVSSGSVVAILADEAVNLITAILATRKAGGAFMPLDTALPQRRLQTMLRVAEPGFCIAEATHLSLVGRAWEGKALRVICLDDSSEASSSGLAMFDGPESNVTLLSGYNTYRNSTPASLSADPDQLSYIYFTSGSTGTPKAIAGRLKGIDHFVRWEIDTLGLNSGARVSHLLPPTFDGSLRDIFVPLCSGGVVCVPPERQTIQDAPALVQWLESEAVEVVHCVPSLFRALLNSGLNPERLPALRFILMAGEVLLPADVGKWMDIFGERVQLINLYGATETTMAKFCHIVTAADRERRSIPVGKPIPGASAFVADAKGRPCPTGITGEIYINTPYRSLGYYNQPELTAEVFVANPLSNDAAEIVHKTGDLGRMLPDGNFEYIGRRDQQVKVRGMRVELAEIENVLRADNGVKDVAVIAREDRHGSNYLCAYVVLEGLAAGPASNGRREATTQVLQEKLGMELPDYMVPGAFVVLSELPRTISGKVDRRALPAPGELRERNESQSERARTPVEEVLTDIWREVLGVEGISPGENFFHLGGHSLLATQVMSRVREAFQVELPLRALFEVPTVAGLALNVEAALRGGPSVGPPPISNVSRTQALPLSFAQQRLWFLDQLEPGSAFYNVPAAVRMSGPLNVRALEETLTEIVRRHEALRTVFPIKDGQPVQQILAAEPVRLEVTELSALAAEEREREARRLATAEAQRPFNLATGPLLRASLLRLSAEEHVALFTLHHIISDGWSLGVLVREVATLYAAYSAGEVSPLPELTIQYADYAHWQREWLQGEVLAEQLAYWREQLAGAPAVLELPADRPRPAVQSFRGASMAFTLPAELTAALQELSRREGVTLFMTLLAAFQTLLYRYTGQADICVGTPIAGRNRKETEGLIGFFVNTLVLAVNFSDRPTIRDLLRRVREVTLGAYTHQDVPFERLVEELQPERELSRHPLFQVMFALQNAPQGELSLPGLSLGVFGGGAAEDGETVKFDLGLTLAEQGGVLLGGINYNVDLFDRSTIQRMASHYERLLCAIASAPAHEQVTELELLSGGEREELLSGVEAEEERERVECLQELFEAQVQRTPEARAVVCGEAELSYRELDERAEQVARRLRRVGVRAETVVGVCVERSLATVVGLLGVLKAGGVYLPLDPEHPAERVAFMLADARAAVVLTQPGLARLPESVVVLDVNEECERESSGELEPLGRAEVSAANLAYIIYTSGSTGRPKGVGVEHRQVVNTLTAAVEQFGLQGTDVGASIAPSSFDISLFELLSVLLVGGAVQIVRREEVLEPQRLGQTIRELTVLHGVPSLLRQVVREARAAGMKYEGLRQVWTGGDVVAPELLTELQAVFPQALVTVLYGPTEAAVFGTSYEARGAVRGHVIGRGIAGVAVRLCDESGRLVPVGVVGEIWLGGAGVSRGYLQRSGLTAERYQPDEYSGRAGARVYRTGDLGRWRADGTVEFVGRQDEQVKVRGQRVELGEVESALRAHEGVAEAVVVVRADGGGEQQLVGYVVRDRAVAAVPVSEIREYLRRRLPEYMVPGALVELAEMPLSSNGKVDRRALPAPETLRAELEYVAPRNQVEQEVARIWGEVLGVERVGVAENFFELGGHSLLATQVISRLRAAFGVAVPLRSLFEAPTVAGIAAAVERMRGNDGRIAPPVVRISREQPLPLSFAQQRLWFLDQLEPNSSAYNLPSAVRLQGELDVVALERTLSEIVRRHEALRTVFPVVQGQPVQAILPAMPVSFPVTDLSALPEEEREREARRLISEEAQTSFDLACGPLLRTSLLRLSEAENIVLFTMHHIISDGWSESVLVNEVTSLYRAFSNGEPSPLPELEIQYVDHAYWQHSWLQGEVLENQLDYWKKQLAAAPAVLGLPTDRSRPALQSYRGSSESFMLSSELSSSLKELSQREGVTLFMTLLAAFQTLLYRYSGQEDISVGTSIAGRNQLETEGLIGFFVNTLVLRTDLSGEPSFSELLRRVREVTLEAYAHQDVPFEKLVEELQPQRELSQHPLFQVMFALNNMSQGTLDLPGLTLRPIGGEVKTAKFDLNLTITDVGHSLVGNLEYATDLFDATTITRLLQNFRVLLEGVSASGGEKLGELPLLSEAERRQVLGGWEEAVRELPLEICYTQHFEAQVERTPKAVAVREVGQSLSYEELNRRANRVAQQLREQGVGTESVVGLLARRGVAFLSGLLGILKAGGVYLPLEPSQPGERQRQVLEASQAQVVLVGAEQQAELAGRLSGWAAAPPLLELEELQRWEGAAENPGAGAGAEALAYVIYTSGSTGTPKGAMIEQRGMLNHLLAKVLDLGLEERDVVAQNAAASFDISVWQYLAVLLVGGRVEVLEDEVAHDATRLLVEVERRGVTVLETVPTMLRALLDEVEQQAAAARPGLAGLRWLISNAEGLPPGLCQRWQAVYGEGRLINTWGATECSDDVTHLRVAGAAAYAGLAYVPLGRPLANVRVYVLDGQLRPVPVGVVGELCIAGVSVGRGYLNDEERTKQAFVSDPFVGAGRERLYRTGDLGRWLEDGGLEYVGRADGQVKIRGHRVELGEVESVLRQVAGVAAAVVVARSDERGEQQLVGYVELAKGAAVTVGELRSSLRSRLPEYMAPGALVVLDELPLTANGKIDKRALPAPAMERGESEVEYVGPRSPAEELLAGIWSEVLGLERVGVTENFFELGGHSLLATQVISRVRAAFGVEVPLRSLFEAPTVEELAEIVAREWSGAGSERAPRLVAVPRGERLPLSFAQQRLWFLNQLEPESAFYNVGAAVRLRGTLDVAALERTLTEIVRRHEALRTVFPLVEGQPVQQILTAEPVRLAVTDLSGVPAAAREAEARQLANSEGGRPFDLAQGPLLRASLLRLSDEEHVVLLTLHHIISDGWSEGILMREVATLYRAYSTGAPSPLAELPIQYADYAHWQREWLQGEVLDQQLDYWKQQLAGIPALLELPTDRPRPPVQSFRGSTRTVVLSQPLTKALKELSRREGTTLFMTMLAAFKTLLYRYTGQPDVVVGVPIAGRNLIETENLIGFFVNTLVIRSELGASNSFTKLLHQVREKTLGAYAHQDVPFERLVEDLQPKRSLSRHPLFQVMFALQNAARGEALELPGLTLGMLDGKGETTKFDLHLSMADTGERLIGSFEYNIDLFDEQTITRMIAHFENLLESIVDDPKRLLGELELLSGGEREELLSGVEAEKERERVECLQELFEAQVQRTPEARAVVCGEAELSYRELDERAEQVARRLRRVGVGAETVVGVCVERSLATVVGLLGVLKAGGVYLPLDPEHPAERVAFMLADARAAVVLTQPGLARLPENVVVLDVNEECERESSGELEPLGRVEVSAANLAYIIYTSGSTGRPKGVGVEHRQVVNTLTAAVEQFGLQGTDVGASIAPSSFDISLFELLSVLLVGGAVQIVRREEVLEPQQLGQTIRQLTVLHGVPSLLRQVVREARAAGMKYEGLRQVWTGGDVVAPELLTELQAVFPQALVTVLYGPTEAAVFGTSYEARGAVRGHVIGRGIAGVAVRLCDESGRLVPVGVVGEIWLGGAGVSRGYLQRSGLTAERYQPDEYSGRAGARVYRTGDLGRWRADGTVEFVGRQDEQVKVRGQRVELGEVESALRAHEGVAEAVVVVRADGGGEQQLVGYVVRDRAVAAVPVSEIRDYLRRRLPEYMVPGALVELAEMPLSSNGKVDRRALPAPETLRAELEYVAPRNQVEQEVARIWGEVLGVERVGVAENFFELGGHSLLATQVISRLRAAFGVAVPLRSLFEAPTVAGIAAALAQSGENVGALEIEALPRGEKSIEDLLAELEELGDDEVPMMVAADAHYD